MGISRDSPIFWIPPIISGTGKAMDFKFCRTIYRVDLMKKMLGIVAVGVVMVMESRKFTWHV